ncbi:MAG: hypothetical protein AAGF97_10035, partial [Planctomycetota bacterium]
DLEVRWSDPPPELERGLLLNTLIIDGHPFTFGRRFNRRLCELADRFRLQYAGTDEVTKPTGNLAGELAT